MTVRPKHAAGAFFARMCLYADGEPGLEPDEELPPTCTITFDANGGVGGTTVSVFQRNASETLPTPTREGYEFKGWFTAVSGGTQVTASTIVMADITYYAHWTRGKVQLWEGGPYWATMNIGAEYDAAHVQWGGVWRMPTEQELFDLNSNCDWTWTSRKGVSGYVVRGRGNYVTSSIFLPAAGYGWGTSLECVAAGGYYWFSAPNCELYFNCVEHRKNFFDPQIGFTVRPVQGANE